MDDGSEVIASGDGGQRAQCQRKKDEGKAIVIYLHGRHKTKNSNNSCEPLFQMICQSSPLGCSAAFVHGNLLSTFVCLLTFCAFSVGRVRRDKEEDDKTRVVVGRCVGRWAGRPCRLGLSV
eukprot:scaffold131539_cov43-Cyclotella_meneghiniana.AAC.12